MNVNQRNNINDLKLNNNSKAVDIFALKVGQARNELEGAK